MDANLLPVISLDIKQMECHIQAALGLHNNELSEYVNEAVKKAVADYDFDGEIKRTVNDVIGGIIKEYYNYGRPGYNGIKKAIEESIASVHESTKKEPN
jgi:hypothetical protein